MAVISLRPPYLRTTAYPACPEKQAEPPDHRYGWNTPEPCATDPAGARPQPGYEREVLDAGLFLAISQEEAIRSTDGCHRTVC